MVSSFLPTPTTWQICVQEYVLTTNKSTTTQLSLNCAGLQSTGRIGNKDKKFSLLKAERSSPSEYFIRLVDFTVVGRKLGGFDE